MMKITTGVLFFGFSVHLHSIELISSQPQSELAEPTTLKALFPESNGLNFPPIKTLEHAIAESFAKFLRLDGHQIVEPVPTYLRRGEVIFGYERGDDIKLLGPLFRQPYVLAAFKTTDQRWYMLNFDDLERLGVTRSLLLVRAHDRAAAVANSKYHGACPRANPKAHQAASEAAYLATRRYEESLRTPQFDHGECSKLVEEHYFRIYNEEYERRAGVSSRKRFFCI